MSRLRFSAFLFLVMLFGCGFAGTVSAPSGSVEQVSKRLGGARSTCPLIYTLDLHGLVQIFCAPDNGNGPIGVLRRGTANRGIGLNVDQAGTVYVVRSNGVDVYQAGETEPSLVLQPPGQAQAVATDASLDVYVVAGNNIYVFPPNSTSYTRVLTDSLQAPRSIALDAAGNVFLGFQGIDEIPVGSTNAIHLRNTLGSITGLALDASQDLVACVYHGRVELYASPYTGEPYRSFDFEGRNGNCIFSADGSSLWIAGFGHHSPGGVRELDIATGNEIDYVQSKYFFTTSVAISPPSPL